MVDWNIPKHLARFDFNDLPDGSTKVSVYPHDTSDDLAEARASENPFFQATIQPLRWAPSFPLKLSWASYVGVDISLVQPPLPEGQGSQGELPGTDKWCQIIPGQATRQASLAWVDMSQRDEKGVLYAKDEHFWPGIGRWQLGVKMENATIDFPEGKYWDTPRTML